MKKRLILALLIVIAGFTGCSEDDKEVMQSPVISGIEDTYSILEGVKLELTPSIVNGVNATYVWHLDGKEVAKTLSYVFQQSTPGTYKLELKVGNEGGVAEKTISIAVGSKNFTVEAVTNKLMSLEVPDYMKNNGTVEWGEVTTTSKLYRLSRMTPEKPLFIAAEAGEYLIQVSSGDIKGEMKIIVGENDKELSSYIANVFDYLPAPGQFVNILPKYEEGDTYEDMVRKAAEAIVGKDGGVITLGGWGGSVTFGFDHTIVNVAGKRDFRIQGNGFNDSSEPGIIMVSFDANGNGKPDDEWYEINGSGNFTAENEVWYQTALEKGNDVATYRDFEMIYHKPEVETTAVLKDYIYFTNNKGGEGFKQKNSAHRQPYYPQWIDKAELKFSGIRLAQNAVDQSGQGTFFTPKSFKYGYVDNYGNADERSAIDIDWAIGKDGKKVTLPGIDFVRVSTGVDQENGWLGENSTETGKGMDLHMLGISIDSIE